MKTLPALLQNRKVLIVGFGSIGPAVAAIIRKIVGRELPISCIDRLESSCAIATQLSIAHHHIELTCGNYEEVLSRLVSTGDIIINLSVNVSSNDLLAWANKNHLHYIDTANECWPEPKIRDAKNVFERRHEVLKHRLASHNSTTSVLYHGANPGIVSHFVRQGLIEIARTKLLEVPASIERNSGWGKLAMALGLQCVHISEFDGQQVAINRKYGEFVSTWSPEGFVYEASEWTTLALGTHEPPLPCTQVRTMYAYNDYGCSAIELNRKASETHITSWAPDVGTFRGFLIPHPEAFSIAELLSVEVAGKLQYQPTVNYAYRPIDLSVASLHDLSALNFQPTGHKLVMDDIVKGIDSLGVLFMLANDDTCYWYGSQLDVADARNICEFNNATSMQVAIGVVAGVQWMLEHPNQGVVEPEFISHAYMIDAMKGYLGKLGMVTGKPHRASQGSKPNSWTLKNLLDATYE